MARRAVAKASPPMSDVLASVLLIYYRTSPRSIPWLRSREEARGEYDAHAGLSIIYLTSPSSALMSLLAVRSLHCHLSVFPRVPALRFSLNATIGSGTLLGRILGWLRQLILKLQTAEECLRIYEILEISLPDGAWSREMSCAIMPARQRRSKVCPVSTLCAFQRFRSALQQHIFSSMSNRRERSNVP